MLRLNLCLQLPEIVTMGSVDFEDASRLDFDRQRQARLLKTGLQNRANPASADKLFIQLLVKVATKASTLLALWQGSSAQHQRRRQAPTCLQLQLCCHAHAQ